jgi:hypothetical protein
MEKYRFNLVLIPVDTAASQLLKQRPEWRIEADDGKHILFVLREPIAPGGLQKVGSRPRN